MEVKARVRVRISDNKKSVYIASYGKNFMVDQ